MTHIVLLFWLTGFTTPYPDGNEWLFVVTPNFTEPIQHAQFLLSALQLTEYHILPFQPFQSSFVICEHDEELRRIPGTRPSLGTRHPKRAFAGHLLETLFLSFEIASVNGLVNEIGSEIRLPCI